VKALLDTHAFLWWITDDRRLSQVARDVIGEGENELYLSAASGWEIAIKAGIGRLRLDRPMEEEIPAQLEANGILVLPVQLAHALRVSALPGIHKDPFDRLLVAQAQVEQLPIVTADPVVAQYPVETLW